MDDTDKTKQPDDSDSPYDIYFGFRKPEPELTDELMAQWKAEQR